MSKRLGDIHRRHLADQNLCLRRHLEACQLRDRGRFLSYDLRVYRACFRQKYFAHLIQFLRTEHMTAALHKLRLDLVVNVRQGGHRLLRRTDHAVVKCLGMNHGIHSRLDIAAAVHDNRRIARTHADGGFSRRICRLDHAGTSCGEDHIRRLHQHIGKLQRRLLDPSDNAFRRSGFHRGVQYNLCRFDRTFLCTRMGADQDRVPGLQADQAFEDRRGSRIRGRDHRSNQSHGFRNLFDAVGSVFLDHAAGLHIFIGVVHILCRVMILDHLVFDYAHTGLLARHLCQRNTLFVGCHRRLEKDPVYLLLSEGGKHLLCFFHGLDLLLKQFHRAHGLLCPALFLSCHKLPPL